MNPKNFTPQSPGELVRNIEGRYTFLPDPLPPPTTWMGLLAKQIHDASMELGRLDGAVAADDGLHPALLMRPLLHREAAMSSRIEGTRTDEVELAVYEVREGAVEVGSDAREVSNYLRSLEWAVPVVKERGITVGLIRDLHAHLMNGVRGQEKTPGEFRNCQVYIGSGVGGIDSAKFVPPPWTEVSRLIEDLVRFIREENDLPPLVRMAIAHYQFEAIHPFRDGNGRVGRLLLTLQVIVDLGMDVPTLHLSPFIERDRRAYYDGLLAVSQEGDWAGWVSYILSAVQAQSKDVSERLRRLRALRQRYRTQAIDAGSPPLMLRLIDLIFRVPAIDVAGVAKHLNISNPPARKHVGRLVEAGVLKEVTQRSRDRIFLAHEIMRIVQDEDPT